MPPLHTILNNALELTSGCTEPAAVAYCASFVGQLLGSQPQQLRLEIDRRTYKNAFGAGIPGAGDRRGSEWAVYLGVARACPERRLAIFSELGQHDLQQADTLAACQCLQVDLIDADTLYIRLQATGAQDTVEVLLEGGHTRLKSLLRNGEPLALPQTTNGTADAPPSFDPDLYRPECWPALVEELYQEEKLTTRVRQGIACNMAAASHGRQYVTASPTTSDSLVMGAIYARMNGDPIEVMSCAGSGNKGLTCMIPVVTAAREAGLPEEKETKGVLASILLTTMITTRFGEVSSVCGAQYAAGAGVIAGLLYLQEALSLFHGAYNNFVSAIGGGFCDGAKGSCSMRGNLAVAAAQTAISHAQAGFIVSGRDGFLGPTFAQTLDNLVAYNPIIARFELETIRILQDK